MYIPKPVCIRDNTHSAQYPTLNAPIATKVVCLSRLLKCLRSLYGKKCGPSSDCSCSGSTLFASILKSSVILGNYLQQTTSADDMFRCIFFLALQGFIPKTVSDIWHSTYNLSVQVMNNSKNVRMHIKTNALNNNKYPKRYKIMRIHT